MDKQKENWKKQLARVDRREFLRLTAAWGLTATLSGILGASAFADAQEIKELVIASAANEQEKLKAAKYVLKYASGGRLERWPDAPVATASPELIGTWQFKETLERDSKGAIAVDLIQGGKLGFQTKLAKKTQQGVIGGCTCSTQNVAGLIPVWNVTDFPYSIGAEENYWKLLYSKEFNDTVRKKSVDSGIVFLWAFAPHRWFGLRTGIPHEVRLPEHLEGLKIRVTGSKLEQEALKTLPCNPTPLAWGECYTGMKEGAIDGIHVNVAAQVDFNFQEVQSQLVDSGFMFSSDANWLSTKFYRKLPPSLQEAILEAAYQGTVAAHDVFEPFHVKQVGNRPQSPADSICGKSDVKVTILTSKEKEVWKEWLAYDQHKEKYAPLVERFGKKEFETVLRVARASGKPEKRRWWKA